MEPWREELDALKAHLAVQHMALQALFHSHPDPASVLEEWRKLRADSVAAAYATPKGGDAGAWLTEPVQRLAANWLAELTLAASRRHPRPGAGDGGAAPAAA